MIYGDIDMNENYITGENFSLKLEYNEHSLSVADGKFGEMTVKRGPLFEFRIKNTENGCCQIIKSDDVWGKITADESTDTKIFSFSEPCGVDGIKVTVTAEHDGNGISWQTEVANSNPLWSVMDITYPTPTVTAENFSLFVPDGCGIVIPEANKKSYSCVCRYPGGVIVMQYFAAYGKHGGIYLGIEDGKGAVKEFDVRANDGDARVKATFYGINASKGANSFALFGKCRWQ